MYNKLFSKILDSSIWLEPVETRIVWITLLAAMDEDGYAHFAAMENLANRARVTVEQAAAAIATFESPDKNSSNPANSGRRVRRVPGGYMILNASAHRAVMNRIQERETVRNRVAKHRLFKSKRAKDKEVASTERYIPLHTVTHTLPTVTPASVYESASDSVSGKGSIEGKGSDASQRNLAPMLKVEIGKHYRRGPLDSWTYAEESALVEIANRAKADAEWLEILAYRNQMSHPRFFPHTVISLLEKWAGVLDTARRGPECTTNYENHERTDRKGTDRNAGTYNAGRASDYANAAKSGHAPVPKLPNIP